MVGPGFVAIMMVWVIRHMVMLGLVAVIIAWVISRVGRTETVEFCIDPKFGSPGI